MNFGANLREARKAAKMTQQQMADILCIDRTTYTKYESRNVQPSFEQLVVIAKVLQVSVDDLLLK
ncbi:MAG: helix-turn-helix transcriptional regulator [Clostridia bacterium]|nr:helix-turn-helix transcriptional regulator [Clostridia bacterium]